MRILQKALQIARSLISPALKAVDVRDFFVFGGLGMLGYGLWLLRPWLGWAVVGLVLFVLGLLWPVFLNLTAKRGR